MSNNTIGSFPQAIGERLCGALSASFSKVLAGSWHFATDSDNRAPAAADKFIHFEFAGPSGQVLAGIAEADALQITANALGQSASSSAPLGDEQTRLVKALFEEAMQEALVERELSACPAADEVAGEMEMPLLCLTGSDGIQTARLCFRADHSVLDGVLQRYDAIGSAAEAGAAATGVAAEAAAQFGYANLDMLMDVELNVTLCFGRRKMELKEIAELSFGAVVELDKEVQAPVDLMLGERVIARGDVVIVDGNYGLRVTQVCAAMA